MLFKRRKPRDMELKTPEDHLNFTRDFCETIAGEAGKMYYFDRAAEMKLALDMGFDDKFDKLRYKVVGEALDFRKEVEMFHKLWGNYNPKKLKKKYKGVTLV